LAVFPPQILLEHQSFSISELSMQFAKLDTEAGLLQFILSTTFSVHSFRAFLGIGWFGPGKATALKVLLLRFAILQVEAGVVDIELFSVLVRLGLLAKEDCLAIHSEMEVADFKEYFRQVVLLLALCPCEVLSNLPTDNFRGWIERAPPALLLELPSHLIERTLVRILTSFSDETVSVGLKHVFVFNLTADS
jgi:hypothetical protein